MVHVQSKDEWRKSFVGKVLVVYDNDEGKFIYEKLFFENCEKIKDKNGGSKAQSG